MSDVEILDAVRVPRRASTLDLALQSCAAATERALARGVEIAEIESKRARLQRHSWKGAEVSRIYSDWLTSLRSPNEELSGSLRELRSRARELARNNPYAGGYLDNLSTTVIGPRGFRMRAKTRDRSGELVKDQNDAIEAAWLDWTTKGPVTVDGRLSFLEFEDLAFQTMAREGECFVQRVVGAEFRHGLGLQIVDPDLVDESYNMITGGGRENEVYMGVEVDAYGRRVAYHVLDYYQYGPGYQGRGRIRLPAENMLHLYRPKRAHQMRGVTWLARIMTTLHNLERYFENELVGSAAASGKMGFIINEGAPIGMATDDAVAGGKDALAAGGVVGGPGGSRVSMEAEPGTIQELEQGQKFESWDPTHPSQAFGDFTRSMLLSGATGSDGATYESFSGDYSNVTYLSARAARIDRATTVERLQQLQVRLLENPVADWWLQSALLTGDLRLSGGDWRRYRDRQWQGYVQPWIDPEKDALAAAALLNLNLTSEYRLAASRGDDYEEILEERERAKKAAAKRGIVLSSTPAPATLPTPPATPDPSYDASTRPSKNGAPAQNAPRFAPAK